MNQPPVAEVRPRSSALHKLVGGSRLWLLTLLCLVIAAALVWWSMPQRGTTIHIEFPEGHGLQPEDTVRYRGIEVGTVESVHLGRSLGGVQVEVLLKPSAMRLATEGTRFWIVRPELSLTRISGLETAIGHKYIGVSPGKDTNAAPAHHFQGLADVPVDTLSGSGIELILRGDKRHSVSKGSQVTFRGVEVGTVLDVALSREARHVDVRVRIFDQHRSLLTSETKFWASSGLDLDFKFGFNGGFNLDTESLETLARGGVSMITTGQGRDVSPGDVFTLHASAEDDWFNQAKDYRTTNVPLRGAVPFRATWDSRGLFGKKQKQVRFNGVAIKQDNVESVLLPTDVLDEVREQEPELTVGGKAASFENIESLENSPVVSVMKSEGNYDAFDSANDFLRPSEPIKCMAIRRSEDLKINFHMEIPVESIKIAEGSRAWEVIDFNGDRDVWHGAPVVASSDGRLVGVLFVTSTSAVIETVESLGL